MTIDPVPPFPDAPKYGSLWVPVTTSRSDWLFAMEPSYAATRLVSVLEHVSGVGLVASLMNEDFLRQGWRRVVERVQFPTSNDEAERAFGGLIAEARGTLPHEAALALEVTAELASIDVMSKSSLEVRAEAAEAEVVRLREELAARVAGLADTMKKRSERDALRWATTEALYGVARVKFRLLRLPEWGALEPDVQGGLFDQISHYDVHRQWEPFPRGDTAAIRADQELLCSVADDLLGRAARDPSGAAFKPRRGWASGITSQRQEPEEIDHWARLGYAALSVKQRAVETARADFIRTTHSHGMGAVPAVVSDWAALTEDDKVKYREMASTVARVASFAQVDAIRRCLMEESIDPVFSGPIVALIVFGGQTGNIERVGGPVRRQ